MSDLESGSRPEVSLSVDPLEDEAFPTRNPPVAKKRKKLSCRPARHIDVAREPTYVPCHSNPTHAGLSSENHDQSSVFAIMYEHLRRDYRKVRPTIYKVPKELKRGDENEGYEPVAVRIGPFTGKNSSTAQLESYKWCCVRQLMGLHKDHPDSHVTAGLLNSCLESMKHLEPEIRASYSEAIKLSSDDLALNMLLDGCFILRRLLKSARIAEREAQGIIDQDEEDDDKTQFFGRVWVWELVATDLVLLENQIPFFVLSKLFELLWSRDDEPKDALVKGSLRLFRSLCPYMLRSSGNSEIDYHGEGVRVHHLLHLFYLSVTSPRPRPSEGDNTTKHSSCWRRPILPDATRREAPRVDVVSPQWIPCAKELEEAGVKVRKRKEAKSFLDIEFNSRSGILEIPPLELYDNSDKLFRNLIAFEQTYPVTRCAISTYAAFMDCLIKTPEDMRILHLRCILVNLISGEQDASRFFSRICAQVRYSWDKNYQKDVMKEVNDYRGSRLHKWRAALVRNYFSNPWVAMSVLAAVLLLAMTILQTTFTVYPYFNPQK